jgi:ABC-type transporter Mla maintaining outer membrane lipid asymmetry permease subunit MlaE
MADSALALGARYIGVKVTDWVGEVGRVTLMYVDMIRSAAGKLPSFRLIVDQMKAIGAS